MQPVAIFPVANTLGEGVVWDDQAQSAYWTDIQGRTLYRLDWAKQALQKTAMPVRLASFGFIGGQASFIGAFEDGFALFDPGTGQRGRVLAPEGLQAGLRMNDGRVDRQGRFWAGSMAEDPALHGQAQLYCVAHGAISTEERGVSISNGLCWSPDGTICYFADSIRQVMWQYRVDASGRLGMRREFAVFDGSTCPDGATVDAEGYVWVTVWGGGRVLRLAPDGRTDRVLEVPVAQPSCVAFGGADLDLLFVTSAQHGLPAPQTGAGDLFVYNVGVRGLAESRFKIDGWPENPVLED